MKTRKNRNMHHMRSPNKAPFAVLTMVVCALAFAYLLLNGSRRRPVNDKPVVQIRDIVEKQPAPPKPTPAVAEYIQKVYLAATRRRSTATSEIEQNFQRLDSLNRKLLASTKPHIRALLPILAESFYGLQIRLESVETVDGHNATVLLLDSSPWSNGPELTYSAAVLEVDDEVRDVRSCWSEHHHLDRHTLSLNDVDGDGTKDVTFRDNYVARTSCSGKPTSLDVENQYLDAYRISSQGFQSIIPVDNRFVYLRGENLMTDTLQLKFTRLPGKVRFNTLFEVEVSIENPTSKPVQLKSSFFDPPLLACISGEFNDAIVRKGSYGDLPRFLKPGERRVYKHGVIIHKSDARDFRLTLLAPEE